MERYTIWQGVLEWTEKAENPIDQQKLTRHLPCSVSTSLKDEAAELKGYSWPQKLTMELMTKQLIVSVGGIYLRNSKSVLLHPQNCKALESLTKVMSTGFAGCVHFTNLSSPATCDIKVLILLYTAEKRAYLGFIPNDQAAFVDRLHHGTQQQVLSQQLYRQELMRYDLLFTLQTITKQQDQQMGARERHTIWHGVLEWIEKNPNDEQKLTRHVPCSVTTILKDGEPELKANSWPQKLIMQLMPMKLIGSIGGKYLRNSKSVLFHLQNCEALESLTKVMSTGFAGCVHFTSPPSPATCDIKVLILLYTAEKRAYLGFIPNDQAAFVDRLRKVIQQQKSSQQLGRQGQVATGVPGPAGLPSAPGQQMGAQQQINTPISQPPNSQQGIMMSQTNTMAMGGGQITQNVVSSTSQPNHNLEHMHGTHAFFNLLRNIAQQEKLRQQLGRQELMRYDLLFTLQTITKQQDQQMGARERHTIWHGVLEWIEKNPNDEQKLTRHVPCSVTTILKDGEPELKANSWPQKLIMQLMPMKLIGSIGGKYLRNSKSVLFHLQNCEALESLTKVMSTGFAGCVHFTSPPSPATCDIKVLILLYTAEKRAYLGFIPNDQAAFVDRLRKVIQQQKSSQQLGRQGQVATGVPGPAGLPSALGQQMGAQQQINTPISQPPNSQQGIMMSQTNRCCIN